MGDVMIAVLGAAAIVIAACFIVFATTRFRNDRRRQVRLSIAFDRAQSVRTRGSALEGNPHGLYAEPVRSARRARGSR